MGRKTFSISFMIRRARMLKNHEAPIYMRITVDGERAEISIKRSIDPAYWNEVKGYAKTGSPYAKELNYFLEQVRHIVYEHQQELINRNKVISAESLKNAFLNVGDDDRRTLLQTYEEHNKNLELRIDKGVSRSTYIRHTTSKKHLEMFLQTEYKKNDILLRDVDHTFIVKYETYLRAKRNCNNNTTVKYIRNLGKIIREAMRRDWIKVDPFRNIKFKTEEVDKPFLNRIELNAIINKKLELPRIAFVDVKSLCLKDLETGFDGNLWIKKQRHKSKQWAHIPLLPVAKQIIDKYHANPECIRKGVLLPVLTNQKMNAYLKEVADLCGIRKNLTTHCARHTFATTVTLANKISMESVSKMLGHSSLAMTKKYARILDSTIGQEMNQLAEKLQFHMN
jgi:site-specific recombinase XerD